MRTSLSAGILGLVMTPGGAAAQTPELQTAVEIFQRHHDVLRQSAAQLESGGAAAKPAERKAPVPATAGSVTARDPFAESDLMLQGMGGFQGGDLAGRLPTLRLRGLVRGDREGGVALLEIEGAGTFMLRPGETVTLRNEQNPLTLRLKRINAASIEVEAGQAQQVVVR